MNISQFKGLKVNAMCLFVCCAFNLIIGFLIPSLVIYCLDVFVSENTPADALAETLRKQFAEGENIFLLAAIGLLPFIVLSIACFIAAYRLNPAKLACFYLFGFLGIVGFMIPSHIAVWYPHYSGGRMSSTSIISFIFIPFICVLTLGIGLLIGWYISRLPFLCKKNDA